jgi:hypothetical protein
MPILLSSLFCIKCNEKSRREQMITSLTCLIALVDHDLLLDERRWASFCLSMNGHHEGRSETNTKWKEGTEEVNKDDHHDHHLRHEKGMKMMTVLYCLSLAHRGKETNLKTWIPDMHCKKKNEQNMSWSWWPSFSYNVLFPHPSCYRYHWKKYKEWVIFFLWLHWTHHRRTLLILRSFRKLKSYKLFETITWIYGMVKGFSYFI